jgi:hypothetical protein
MKNNFILLSIVFVMFCPHLKAQIKITTDNKVGVRNSSPCYKIDLKTENNLRLDALWKIYVNGVYQGSDDTYDIKLSDGPQEAQGGPVAYVFPTLMPTISMGANLGTSTYKWRNIYADYINCRDIVETSDEKLKQNIRYIDYSLDKVLKLKPVLYNFKRSYYIPDSLESTLGKYFVTPVKDEIGFLAQELMQVVPEAVYYDEESELYGIDYTDLVPILTKAIQEQQAIIAIQDAKIKSLESQVALIKAQIEIINKKLIIK